MSDIRAIAKEEIANVLFVSYEVLDDTEEKHRRKADLERAMILGNGDHGKARIIFMTVTGVCEVETTVWATTDETVTLKGGVTIPIHCIRNVRFT